MRITGMTTTCGADGEWEYIPVVVGLHPITDCIRRRKVTIVENVACCPIYELFIKTERRTGMSPMMRWWDQDVVNKTDE